ncbi:glutamate dehydrogenase (NADP+) [Elusimicrobium posterum]|uniref:NADP-specific glutamate dehydrogenase n=1 Tax=Elusimicrobium posterum TaxID=3116653 RepID=UPI003C7108C9
MNANAYVKELLQKVIEKNPAEDVFHQAVEEVLLSLAPVIERHPEILKAKILERIVEPERVISFRVPWQDDKGEIHVNRGFRVEFNSALGPYKGGLRFRETVNQGMLKFLGFEQVFKNSLTTLPMGGGKGGSDFDPKGKSDSEVMRFCQSFMTELYRHIGPNTDVPAGDIGVGAREIGYMFGQYKRIKNEFTGVLTGKALEWGGSLIRPEATGYGSVYFAQEMLATRGDSLKGKKCVVSGAGNVATFTIEKINQLGGSAYSFSNRDGAVYDKDGIDEEKLAFIKEYASKPISTTVAYVEKFKSAEFLPKGQRVWNIAADCAFPSAHENELNGEEAATLLKNGCFVVSEGANMPATPEALNLFVEKGILYAPGKAANAGGVATSGLEMSQNSLRLSWSREEVDLKLQNIMKRIHRSCVDAAAEYDLTGNYVAGANIAGFKKVAKAMMDQGLV